MKEYDYSRPIEFAKGVFWVGFNDQTTGLRCNPYLIIDNDEAVLIDGGSRPDFPQVMMKILKTGIVPSAIKALIFQHYDPDLCGSLPNLENIIDSDKLKIYSAEENHMFIKHYSAKSEFVGFRRCNLEYTFKSGRKLKFIKTPYAHTAGSFVTFDEQNKILFSSDLLGSYCKNWALFLDTDKESPETDVEAIYEDTDKNCPIKSIYAFHRMTFPSNRILRHAINILEQIDFDLIAPQHGSIVNKQTGRVLLKKLAKLDNVGIDGICQEQP